MSHFDGTSDGTRKKPFFFSRKRILSISFVVALLMRGCFFLYYCGSPFRHFHKIAGLDMETLLRFSEWGCGREFTPLFVVHRILIYLVWLFNGKVHSPPAVILIQCLAGAAGAALTADLILMLWGKRKAALLAGVFYGVYAPLLLYDFTILQESSSTFLILLGVWSYFRARSRHFSGKSSYFSGLLLGLCSVGRPVAVLLAVIFPVKTFFEGRKKAALVLAAGVCTLLLTAVLFNRVLSNNWNPFFRVMPYTMAFHAQQIQQPVSGRAVSRSSAAARLFLKLPSRAARFFLAFEVPENLNYYFLRTRLTPMKHLPGPGALMPFALAGILLMLPRFRCREGILLGVMILLALPLAARDPIGRYRLHLIPYFIVAAAFFCIRLAEKKRRILLLCAGAFLLSVMLNVIFYQKPFFRTADFVAWGKAQEADRQTADALSTYFRGWLSSRYTDRAAAVNLITCALRNGNFALAERTCHEGITGAAEEKSIYHYYLALIYASQNQFGKAEKHLLQIREQEIPSLRIKLQHLKQVVRRKSIS